MLPILQMAESTKSTKITPEALEEANANSVEKTEETQEETTVETKPEPKKRSGNGSRRRNTSTSKPAPKVTAENAENEENEGEPEAPTRRGRASRGVDAPYFSEAHINSIASERERKVLKELNKQPLVRVRLPLDRGEKAGVAFVPVVINGLRFEVMKGVARNVPEQIAKLVESSEEETENAVNQFSTDREEIGEDGKLKDFKSALRL